MEEKKIKKTLKTGETELHKKEEVHIGAGGNNTLHKPVSRLKGILLSILGETKPNL